MTKAMDIYSRRGAENAEEKLLFVARCSIAVSEVCDDLFVFHFIQATYWSFLNSALCQKEKARV
jgi:hypothetical protein